MISESDLIISMHPENATSDFSIVQIIYNHRFGVTSATKSDPEDDIVLIQVHPDFLSVSSQLFPICIPDGSNPKLSDLVGQRPYYSGLLDNSTSRRWSYAAVCLGETPPVDNGPNGPSDTGPFKQWLPSPWSVGGIVVNADNCGQNSDNIDEADEPLIRFKRTSGKPPKWGDGTLVLESFASDHRVFLVGITASPSVEMKRNGDDDSTEYIRFSKISRAKNFSKKIIEPVIFVLRLSELMCHNFLGLVKYIEFQAARARSRWCRSGSLKLMGEEYVGPGSPQERTVGDHPWDQPGVSYPRDEILKCGNVLIIKTKNIYFYTTTKPDFH